MEGNLNKISQVFNTAFTLGGARHDTTQLGHGPAQHNTTQLGHGPARVYTALSFTGPSQL